MKLTKEEMSLLHFACGKVMADQEELKKLSNYAKDQYIELQTKLLKEIQK